MNSENHLALFCDCSYNELFKGDIKDKIQNYLKEHFPNILILADFCGIAVNDAENLKTKLGNKSLLVFACYSRTIDSLFQYIDYQGKKAKVFNMRSSTYDEIVGQLKEYIQTGTEIAKIETIKNTSSWVSWYPVVDSSRCTQCQKCFDYCLFGVYSVVDGEVIVNKPENCKTNCPACSRLCPTQAIIFPKFTESPYNGSDEKPENIKVSAENMMRTIPAGNQLESLLRARSVRAKSPLFKKE